MNENLAFQANQPEVNVLIEMIGKDEVTFKIEVKQPDGSIQEHLYPRMVRGEGFVFKQMPVRLELLPLKYQGKKNPTVKKEERN